MTTNLRCGRTKVKTEHFIYEWTIENFRFLDHEIGEVLDSPHFSVGSKNVVWNLKFYPCGANRDISDFVSMFLCLQSKGSADFGINVKYEVSIVKSDEILIKQHAMTKYKKEGTWGWSKFIERAKLLHACESNESLIIRCSMEQALTTVTESTNFVIPLDLEEYKLGEDCRQLIKDQDQFSDVIIIVNNKKFPVHKVFLAARSPVFKAMFTHSDLSESRTKIVEIVDFEPEVIEGMIEFIYTDKVTNLAELADRLIAAAHKYELKRLRNMCEGILGQNLNTKNAVNVLTLADLYGAQQLLDHTINFIADHFREVAVSESYDNIDNLELLKKILRAVAERRG